ncbi:4-alpha-glucanotransferase [Sediminihabitans luteus]|uniref:4-alpha-glucanotransferase n=1 Tax=Sediminihabitans luteus TaxID=1138585 RepID=A0A2M9CYM1_9CELL|nr:4-alpha-glucanotransferase [Sediminihabitans luteus]PJJ76838.1 4-alpha-glucanotransferase [Sediminihabitans luteus]GIJ00317.1 4-alpha-glucanotransferase [Sediminihabitans luteus]
MNADTTDHSPTPLQRLAAAHGVATEVDGPHGRRAVRDTTLVAVLGAMGVPAATPALVSRSLDEADDAPWAQVLPEAVVTVEGVGSSVAVHVRDGDEVEVWVELEVTARRAPAPRAGSHAVRRDPVRVDLVQQDVPTEPRTVLGRLTGRATFALPDDLPLGWHVLRARTGGTTASTPLVVTPARLDPAARLGDEQRWGYVADLYAVRSRRSWGLGDLADLADLAWLAAHETGADYVLVDPVHAAEPVAPRTASPYAPSSRRCTDPLLVRVEEIPETAYLSAADRSLVEWSFDEVRDLATDPGPLDRDAAWAAKRAALEVVFAAPRSVVRQAAFEDFRTREGQGLIDVATWFALVEHHAGRDLPPALDDPRSPAVAAMRDELHERVELHVWVQWVAAEQRESAQRAATAGGMRLGVVHTLAAGPAAYGADAWALGPLLARGVTLGTPPTAERPDGVRSTLVPWDPRALRRAGYAPYRDVLRATLRGAGALRVDQALGLFRSWWVPGGARADAGTWVEADADALVGILCLEAQRAGALLIADDRTVTDPAVRDALAARGVLGTTLLWDETDEHGTPRAPETFRAGALAGAVARDMPPSGPHLAGEHLEVEDDPDGLVDTDADVARRRGLAARDAMVLALVERGVVGPDPSERELVEGLYRYLRATPSALVAVSLADAVGERRAQHRPDDPDYPSWNVPLAGPGGDVVLLEEIFDSARLQSLAAVVRDG